MLLKAGYDPVLFVAPSFEGEGVLSPRYVEIRKIAQPEAKLKEIEERMRGRFDDLDVVICHDIFFLRQHRLWAKAARNLAKQHPSLAWMHWQHSRGDNVLTQAMPNSYFCYPNRGDLDHVAAINSTDLSRVRYIPHPLDFDYLGWPDLAVRIAEDFDFHKVDVAMFLPTRFDRQKQIERAVRIAAGIKRAGRSVCFLVADAYATGDHFLRYKEDLLAIAKGQDLTKKEFVLLGETYEECKYATPRPVVKALFEMGNLFVQPSNSETSSLIVMEAIFAGNLVIINRDFPPIHHLYKAALTLPFGSVTNPDTKYYKHIQTAGGQRKVEDPQAYWDDQARLTILSALDSQLTIDLKRQQIKERWPSTVFDEFMEPVMMEALKRQPPITLPSPSEPAEESIVFKPPLLKSPVSAEHETVEVVAHVTSGGAVSGDPEVTAVIMGRGQLSALKVSIPILMKEVGRIIVVNNGGADENDEVRLWSEGYRVDGLEVINREDKGAGVGRNTGLDRWGGSTKYVLMLDMGVRPFRKGIATMKRYLEAHPEVDVISPEVTGGFTTDDSKAHRRLDEIDEGRCFRQMALSSTAYALCRTKAWDGIRYCEEGPFGERGWGVDDNELQVQWNKRDIIHHDFGGFQVFRQSGSAAGIQEETGVSRLDYGSVYEQRLVFLQQRDPGYFDVQWQKGHIDISVVVLGWNEYPMFAKAIKVIHEDLEEVPHEVIFVDNGSTDETRWWLDTYALRWHHSTRTIDANTGGVLERGKRTDLEPVWTGNVIRVDLPENVGAGRGFNAGFDRCRGKYVFYLAGDILPVEGSIKAMYEYLEKHNDADFVCINAWCNQSEDENPPMVDFEAQDRHGLGNYAYSYAMMRREILDAGIRMADKGPFATPGCGYEELEFAHAMGAAGFEAFTFNQPTYYHHRRDFERSGLPDIKSDIPDRKRWLEMRWTNVQYNPMHHPQPLDTRKRKVAIVYKRCADRPGPGGLLLEALKDINVAQQFQPDEVPSGYDNYIFVDDGDFGEVIPCPEYAHPSAFWAIDMVIPQQDWRPSLEGYVERSKAFDKVYAAQPAAARYLNEHGVEAQWLPLAASEDLHRPYVGEKSFDWIALWHNCGHRIPLIEQVSQVFPDGFVGWKDGDYGKEYAQWICRARCALNLSRSNELTMRVFEVMACGVPLVTDRARGLDLLFEEKEHYLGFDSVEEAIEQIRWVKEYPDLAMEMAMRARAEVLAKHTYYHRVSMLAQ
jgi:glycosyltransferase involved in cell wall biosynthesis